MRRDPGCLAPVASPRCVGEATGGKEKGREREGQARRGDWRQGQNAVKKERQMDRQRARRRGGGVESEESRGVKPRDRFLSGCDV